MISFSSRLIKGEEEERGEDRDAKRNKQLEHASQRYSAGFKEEITETAGMPSMRTRIQSSQQRCQLQDETSTQASRSNACINRPAHSEMYIVHWCTLANLMLRLCWNLSRLDSLCMFNHRSFVSSFQPAVCQHHFVFEKYPPRSFVFNPASFPSSRKEN